MTLDFDRPTHFVSFGNRTLLVSHFAIKGKYKIVIGYAYVTGPLLSRDCIVPCTYVKCFHQVKFAFTYRKQRKCK